MNKSKLEEAKQLFSEEGGRYICKDCGKQRTNMSSHTAHIRTTHERIKYHCGQCEHKTASKANLERHRRSIHEGRKYPCL